MDKLQLYISRVSDHNIVCKLFPLITPLHPGVANLLWAIKPISLLQ
jgi:hypothetical protein